jgi:hypothetical protein
MCTIGLIVEYSRMQVPSLSSGCEIAHFFVRYMEVLVCHRCLYRVAVQLAESRCKTRSNIHTPHNGPHLQIACSPNEEFGRRNKRCNADFSNDFSMVICPN